MMILRVSGEKGRAEGLLFTNISRADGMIMEGKGKASSPYNNPIGGFFAFVVSLVYGKVCIAFGLVGGTVFSQKG